MRHIVSASGSLLFSSKKHGLRYTNCFKCARRLKFCVSLGDALYRKIEINGFKSLRKVSINPSLMTVFVGPNGSGKSSVLQALTLLKQSRESVQLRTQGQIINLGQWGDIISKGSNRMLIEISGVLSPWESPELLTMYRLRYKIAWRFQLNGSLTAVSASMASDSIDLEASWMEGEEIKGNAINIKDFAFSYQAQRNTSKPIQITASAGSGEKASFWRDLNRIVQSVDKQLDLTYFVPPFRGQDLPQYTLQGSPQLQITSTAGSVQQASRLASTIAYRRELEAKISNWIERITGVRVSSELVPGPHVTIRAHPKKPKVSPIIVNEGYGSNQLVHLMGQIAMASEGSSICIDDPEIHLHPKAQAELAELLVEIAKDEHKQLLMTTHSEHIIFRLLTLVAEKKLNPQELAIYYFDKRNGWTQAKRLTVDAKGTLAEGLPGFFEADVREFRKYIEAISRKPKK